MSDVPQPVVHSRQVAGVLVETYHRQPSPPVRIPRHSHDSYLVCLNDVPWVAEKWYRHRWWSVLPRSVEVIPPGEVHAARDVVPVTQPATYRVFYLPAEVVGEVAEQRGWQAGALVEFGAPAQPDPVLYRMATLTHQEWVGEEFSLVRDCRLLGFMDRLLDRRATGPVPPKRQPRGRPEVARARDFLLDNLAVNVSLIELARVAALSQFHLVRAFHREVGMSPHAYHLQARVDRAKALLLDGRTASEVAQATGFFDLSHLGRHFRRIVGISPGMYAAVVAEATEQPSVGPAEQVHDGRREQHPHHGHVG